MAKLLLIILLIVVGSKVIYKDNFAILTGNIPLTNGSGQVNVNYPDGFDSSNCVVVSLGIDIYASGKFSFVGDAGSPLIYEARLADPYIVVKTNSVDNIGTTNTKQYKIVLMKTN